MFVTKMARIRCTGGELVPDVVWIDDRDPISRQDGCLFFARFFIREPILVEGVFLEFEAVSEMLGWWYP